MYFPGYYVFGPNFKNNIKQRRKYKFFINIHGTKGKDL
jgi:hypothetical protein